MIFITRRGVFAPASLNPTLHLDEIPQQRGSEIILSLQTLDFRIITRSKHIFLIHTKPYRDFWQEDSSNHLSNPGNGGTQLAQFFFNFFVAAVEVVDPIDQSLSVGN